MDAPPTRFFETERLVFRPFEAADLDALAAINADPEVLRFVGDGKPIDRATTALWIERSRANVARHGSGTGAVVERASGALIGWAGVARPKGQPPEIIYGFAKAYWGRGLGRELLGALVDWAAPLVGPELRATADLRNVASITLLDRAGFRLVDRVVEEDGAVTGVFLRPVEPRRA